MTKQTYVPAIATRPLSELSDSFLSNIVKRGKYSRMDSRVQAHLQYELAIRKSGAVSGRSN